MDKKRAISQLKKIKKLTDRKMLLAADWKKPWQVLISTMLSAQTKDETTIRISHLLYRKYGSLEKLSKARLSDIKKVIKPVNFYKTKAGNIKKTAEIITGEYNGKIPHEINELLKLPGVGRKTANVFLDEQGQDTIGIDVHLTYVSNYLGWSKHKDQHKIEIDLENLFPQRFWSKLNWIVVRFGQTYPNRKIRNKVLGKLKKI